MTLQMTTHLNFRGEAREALEFYRSVFGGETTLVTYADLGAAENGRLGEQVMWGQVAGADGFRVMAYDVQSDKAWHAGENAFYVSVRGTSVEEITTRWNQLCDGASILHALGASAWSPLYGMLKDRFGVTWIMDVAAD